MLDAAATGTLFQTLGLPVGMLVVLLYGVFKMCKWASPKIDNAITKYNETNEKNYQLLKELVDKTTELQESNYVILSDIQRKLNG